MNSASFEMLEFYLIKEQVRERCASNLGKALCDRMQPSFETSRVRILLQETTEAALLVQRGARIDGLHDISAPLKVAETGGVITPGDLTKIASVIRGAAKFKKAMRARKVEAPLLSSYAESIVEMPGFSETIDLSIDGDRVSDSADEDLRKVRKLIGQVEARIQTKLSSLMASNALRDAIQEGYVTVKNGRYVVPVRASHRQRVPGSVVAASSTGQTVFIEPASIQPLVDELVRLKAEEEELVYRVLCRLTQMVVDHLRDICVTVEAMAALDFAFAKGKYSLDAGGTAPEISRGTYLRLEGARHPLLKGEVVPLDLSLGSGYRTLVITGPNTGGKTVLLKSVGLLCLMAQSGLHIPAGPGSVLPVFDEILADIGDRQSIQQSLSTFSSHMENIAVILKLAGPRTLVMLDEIGTGTDPREGAALAAAILNYLYGKGCVTLATTHYGDVKAFSESKPGFVNGCMEFDRDTLKPTYRLSIGQSGESQGINIAMRLGLPHEVISWAREYMGGLPLPVEPEMSPAVPYVEECLPEEREEGSGNKDKGASQAAQFRVGDSVFVSSVNYHGVVARAADSKGDLIVLVKGERLKVNWKRLRLLVKREDLYPDFENYDLNIVLMSKDDRKLVRRMSRKKVDESRVIEPDPE